MHTLLDMARSMLADASLPQKFRADAVQTAAYIRNLIPTTNNPTHIPAEHWSQKRQDVSHLRAFGCTCYAHVPVEISPSKLLPRLVKLTMIGYFEHAGYKLLDRSTGKTFRSRDVVFDEQPPHYSTDSPITYPSENGPISATDLTAIALRPQPISVLHPAKPHTTSTPSTKSTEGDDGQGSDAAVSDLLNATSDVDEPPAVRRSRREVKPSRHMLESLEYLNRPRANVSLMPQDLAVDSSLSIPQTYHEAMKHSDLWFELMVKELQVMKDKNVYRLVPRPFGKNIVKSRWVFANKYDDTGNVTAHKACLVAKGFTQVLGEDYDETYASVARLESV
jgi:hypothetical protein